MTADTAHEPAGGKRQPQDVAAYIAAAPRAAQPMLRRLRQVIKTAAPAAVERFSYGMPFYELHGRLVYFAGYDHHVALYAAVPSNNIYAAELEKYMAARSTIKFPIGQALPVALISRVVKARVKENEAGRRHYRSAAAPKPKVAGRPTHLLSPVGEATLRNGHEVVGQVLELSFGPLTSRQREDFYRLLSRTLVDGNPPQRVGL